MKGTKYLVFMGSGFELIGLLVAGIYLGNILDNHFGKKPLFLIGFLLLGILSWGFHFFVLLNRLNKSAGLDQDSK